MTRRLQRLLGPSGEFSVVVAMDHGIAGFVDGLRDTQEVLERVIAGKPRGVLLNSGTARRLIDRFSGLDSPCLVLALDMVIHAGPRGTGPAVGHGPQVSVEEAIRLGADAVKTMLIVGGTDRAAELANLRYLAVASEQCRRWEMPLMVEPYLWGEGIPEDPQARGELGADGARKAIEMGADLLKLEYPGNPALFESIVGAAPVPVFALGGPRRPSQRDMLADIIAVAHAGAVGVAIGRNIWHQPDPAAMIRAIRIAVEHGDLDLATAQLASSNSDMARIPSATARKHPASTQR